MLPARAALSQRLLPAQLDLTPSAEGRPVTATGNPSPVFSKGTCGRVAYHLGMATLLVEPFGGIAGDMLLAALLDLEDPRFGLGDLRQLSERLVPGECRLELSRVKRGAFIGSHLLVRTDETDDPPPRHLSELTRMVLALDLPDRAERRALGVLERLATAEGRVHGVSKEEVHFHEVGAVDTLIDVVGAAIALERLDVDSVLATPPLTGEGTVRCSHGEMPVPVPAVTEILRGMPIQRGGGPGERLTPTGAALLAELVESFEMDACWTSQAIGYGAGGRDSASGPANMVRVSLGIAAHTDASRRTAWLLEVHLDDMTGEELGWCQEALRGAGALDVWSCAVQMKKNRPGTLVSALCREQERARLEAVIFERTPSLGLRWTRVERTECDREEHRVELDGESLRVKLRRRPDYPAGSPFGARDVSPEYDDLVEFAERRGLTLREAERRVIDQWFAQGPANSRS